MEEGGGKGERAKKERERTWKRKKGNKKKITQGKALQLFQKNIIGKIR